MSKSEDLKNDEGDGDWFKIYYLGPASDTAWATDRGTQVTFRLVCELGLRVELAC